MRSLYEMLVCEHAYTVSYRSVRRYVQRRRPEPRLRSIRRVEVRGGPSSGRLGGVSELGGWSRPTARSGSVPVGDTRRVYIEVEREGLEPGTYRGTLTFRWTGEKYHRRPGGGVRPRRGQGGLRIRKPGYLRAGEILPQAGRRRVEPLGRGYNGSLPASCNRTAARSWAP